MNYGLESGITRFRHRRDRLVKVVIAYKDWLEKYAEVEPPQLLRLFDLTESLKKDRLMLAFVAEFSRALDKAAQKKVIKKNTAARLKSRLNKLVKNASSKK